MPAVEVTSFTILEAFSSGVENYHMGVQAYPMYLKLIPRGVKNYSMAVIMELRLIYLESPDREGGSL